MTAATTIPKTFEPEPGKFYDRLPNEAYHGSAGLSSTRLKRLVSHSPLYFRTAPPIKTTPAMLQGTILHAMVLEPDEVADRYVFAPEIDLRTKKGKEDLAALEQDAAARGAEVIRKDPTQLWAIADAVRSHPAWDRLVGAQPTFERSYYWTDPQTGALLKCRPDSLNETTWLDGDRVLVCDLKSAQDPRPLEFGRRAINLGYDVSAAMYCAGVAQVTGKPVDFCWFAFQPEPPYEVALYFYSHDSKRRGDALYRKALNTLAECEASGNWPGIANGEAMPLHVPNWAKYSDTEVA